MHPTLKLLLLHNTILFESQFILLCQDWMFSVILSALSKQTVNAPRRGNKILLLSHLLSEPCSLKPPAASRQRSGWQRRWQRREWQLWVREHSRAQCSCTIPSLANEALIKVSYVPREGRFHMAQVIQKSNVSQKTPRAQQVSFYRGLPPRH